MAGITSTKKIKGQPHFLAYITPSEAKTLENLGGQKTMTKEGVPAYPPGEKYGGKDSSGNFNDPTPSSPSSSPTNNQSSNDGGQSIQDYYDDYTKLTGTTVITDKDRDDFFAARPDYKAAADKAAVKKKEQQEKARKEKERIDKILETHRGREPKAYNYGKPIKNYKKEYFIGPNKFSTATKMRQLALKNLIDKKMGLKTNLPNIFEMNNLFNPSMQDQDYTYNSGITTDMMGADLQDYFDMDKYGITGKNLTDIDRMNRALDKGRATGKISQTEFEDAFNSQVIPGGNGRDDSTILPYIPSPGDTGGEGGEENTEPDYRFGTGQKVGLDVTLGRYFNQGGRVPRNMGGIMNVVPRQGYFLGGIGKAIKGVVGGVADAAGKVLKSDVGKAALLYAGGVYLGGGNLLSAGSYNPMNFLGKKGYLANIAGKALLKDPSKAFTRKNFSLMKMLGLSAALPFIPGINKAPENENIGMADRGGRLIDPLTNEEGTPASMRENIELAKIEAGGDPIKLAALNQKYNNMLFTTKPYENYGLYANGGRIARAEGGLMNLGGMEKDYRAEGGFVPIGREEKADDVPARLSVNEFVFTADAVRNAGGGDIDKGAEVMENMMKNLENGGRVSEESQGNTGAQEMFSVSERIGEVI